MNPYQILGVSPSSSSEEIRQAYKKLASKWHPDKNNGSVQSAEKFKEIKSAYETLTHSMPTPDFSLGDLFDAFFQKSQMLQLDIELNLNLRISQAALGGPIDVQLPNGRQIQFILPERLEEGHVLRLRGYGHHFQNNFGDLVLKVHIEMPSSWTKIQVELLKKLENSFTGKKSQKKEPNLQKKTRKNQKV